MIEHRSSPVFLLTTCLATWTTSAWPWKSGLAFGTSAFEMALPRGGISAGKDPLKALPNEFTLSLQPAYLEQVEVARFSGERAKAGMEDDAVSGAMTDVITLVKHSHQDDSLVQNINTRQRMQLPGDLDRNAELLEPRIRATAINTTVADIVRNPVGYEGRNVAVNSTLEEIYSPTLIRIDEDQFFVAGIDNDILVVTAEPLALPGAEHAWRGMRVRVIGTVRVLREDDSRHGHAGNSIFQEVAKQFVGKPIIVAKGLERVD